MNNLKAYGRWAFAEFTEVYQIDADFAAKVGSKFNRMIESVVDIGRESARRLTQLGGSDPQLQPIPGIEQKPHGTKVR